MNVTTENMETGYQVKDINLADFGRKEIIVAESELRKCQIEHLSNLTLICAESAWTS